jgi:hypothetical protein
MIVKRVTSYARDWMFCPLIGWAVDHFTAVCQLLPGQKQPAMTLP